MKRSIIIQVRGERTRTTLELISKHGFNITGSQELALIPAIYELYGNTSFMLNEAVRRQLIAKLTPSNPSNYSQLRGMTEGTLKVNISRLIKSGALVRNGKLLGLHTAYKEANLCEQVVLRIV